MEGMEMERDEVEREGGREGDRGEKEWQGEREGENKRGREREMELD